MTFTLAWDIDCPPETAFDLMADLREETSWNVDALRADLTSDGPIGEGSTFHLVHRPDKENDATITVFDRPHRLAFAIETAAMDIVATYSFEARGDVTRFRGSFDPAPKGAMRVLLPILLPVIRRQVARHHREFSAVCEARGEARARA